MRTSVVSVLALVLCCPIPAAAREDVSVSRYRLTVIALPLDTEVTLVDPTEFEERCRDADGCEISLVAVTGPAIIDAVNGRIFLRPGSTGWVGIGGERFLNQNAVRDIGAAVGFGPGSCQLSDADDATNADDTSAFTVRLAMIESVSASCTLTVID